MQENKIELASLAEEQSTEIEAYARSIITEILGKDVSRMERYAKMAAIYAVVAALEKVAPASMIIARQLCEALDVLAENEERR